MNRRTIENAAAIGLAVTALGFEPAAALVNHLTHPGSEAELGATALKPRPEPKTVIDLDSLPHEVPEAIKSKEDRSVVTLNQDWEASGVRYSNNTYITAGHLFYTKKMQKINATEKCGDGLVHSTSDQPIFYNYPGRPLLYGIQLTDTNFTATFNKQDPSNVPDIAFIKAQPEFAANALPPASPLHLSSTLKTGEKVFFVNDEPTSKGAPRSPDEVDLSPDQVKRRLYDPAIYGGFVLKHLSSDEYAVLTGVNSYGVVEDTHGRHGMSGGSAYIEDGEFAGISVAFYEYSYTADAIDREYDVDLTGVRPRKKLYVDILQGINNKLLKLYEHRLAKSPHC